MTERNRRVTTFLNQHEYEQLEKQCSQAGMNQSAYLRSLILSGNHGASQPGYTKLLQHISDLDGAVFAISETAKTNSELHQEDIERMLFIMESVWNKVKGSL